jgi:hypothetical protein
MIKKEPMTVRKAVLLAIMSYKEGERFHGTDLKKKVVKLLPRKRNCYVDTILRTAREVARDKYKCVNIHRSLYERI